MKDYKYCIKSVCIGDFCGSSFEGIPHNIPYDELNDNNMLYSAGNRINRLTDDSVCTFAIASALMSGDFDFEKWLRRYSLQYPYVGYGTMYRKWVLNKIPNGYGSWGNGAAMRCSPIAWYAETLDECMELTEASCECTHNSDSAINGATTLNIAIWLLKNNDGSKDMKAELKDLLYRIPKFKDATFDDYKDKVDPDIEKNFDWYLNCENMVGMCILALIKSESYEDALKLVISEGHDTDTAGAIIGPLAYAYYGEIPQRYLDVIDKAFSVEMKLIDDVFSKKFVKFDCEFNI